MRPSVGLILRPRRRVARVFRTTRRTVESVPDVLEAILMLPAISRQLEVISFQTASLPEMHAEIARVRGDTAMLRQIEANTLAVQQLAEVVIPLQSAALRLGRFADRLPQRRI